VSIVKHSIYAKYKNVMLRPVMPEEIENLRCWRNDPDNAKYLRPIETITPEMQLAWYERDMQDADRYTFAVEETDYIKQIVGSIALNNFQDDSAESNSVLLGDKRARGVAPTMMLLALHIAYTYFDCAKVYGTVNTKNIPSIMTNQKVGYEKIGKHEITWGGEEYDIVITKDRFYNLNPEMRYVKIHTDCQYTFLRETTGV